MWGLVKKQPVAGETAVLKLSGLHCTSCSLNVDGELEETPGVIASKTSYAKSETVVNFDPQKVQKKQLVEIIEKLGYGVVNA